MHAPEHIALHCDELNVLLGGDMREIVTEEWRFGNESGEHPVGARRPVRYAER